MTSPLASKPATLPFCFLPFDHRLLVSGPFQSPSVPSPKSTLRPHLFHSSNQIPKQTRSSSTGKRPQATPQGWSGQVAITEQKSYPTWSGSAMVWWGEATWKVVLKSHPNQGCLQHTSLDSSQKLLLHISSLLGELLGQGIMRHLLYLPRSAELSRALCSCIVSLTSPGFFFLYEFWLHKNQHTI